MLAEIFALLLNVGSAPQLALTPALYMPADRAVSNWRVQAVLHLETDLSRRLRMLSAQEHANLPRCIRLNNYWCVKSARWSGEIATDNAGHVAFSSADEGAAVAAQLLRRYYLDFNRKSALAIISRWAPAECGGPVVASVGGSRSGAKGGAKNGTRRQSANVKGLTTRGLGNTLRARWLASHRPGGVQRSAQRGGKRVHSTFVVRSRVPDRGPAMMRAPSIAVGLGERAAPVISLAPVRIASLGLPALGPSPGPAVPLVACASETVRIRNYAAKMSEGITANATDDLKLFDAEGRPTPNFFLALVNMASVEIGPYRAETDLVRRAVDNMPARLPAE
ncbi:MAG TPA: hypothetical protein VGU72_12225 [Beijerinckiaceae bacterium]|jgi:hypothetical protein|nr:hypothetical protein [Beijerinckiaceae bacterium]